MTLVTESEFFAALSADKRDIMPSIASGWSEETGYASEWRIVANRVLWGRSDGLAEKHNERWFLENAK